MKTMRTIVQRTATIPSYLLVTFLAILAFGLVLLYGSVNTGTLSDIFNDHPVELARLRFNVAAFGAVVAVLLLSAMVYIGTHKHKAEQADESAQLMLDAIPLSCSLWESNANMISCNRESVTLFNLSEKKDFMENFFSLSPEFQPCGRNSREMATEILEKAFTDGYNRTEWMHQTQDGELIPAEVILVRIKHKGEHVVSAYIRDLRELQATMDAMHKVEDDLRLALVVAEDNAKAKGEFLDNMSHELRTPMNGILGFLRMALQDDKTEKAQEYVQKAERSAQDLLKIINDVLDFTELEEAKIKTDAEPFSLAEAFDGAADAYRQAAEAKSLDLNMRLPSDVPGTVVGDARKLTQVLSNLLDNAIKFTEKGKITVRGKVRQQDAEFVEMEFYVKDTGIGIEPGQMTDLFAPFAQADASATRKYGGTGLGLALSRHLVTLLGGRIWADSEPDEGSTFYFTARLALPEDTGSEAGLAPQEADAGQAWEAEAGISGDEGTQADTGLVAEAETVGQAQQAADVQAPQSDDPGAATEPGAASHNPAGKRILVVEDVEMNRLIAEELLIDMGYTVDTANDGQEAVDMVQRQAYDAVLMDIQMPVMDGLTATRKIREIERFQALPILALSAHSMPADREKSLEHGMNDHITKPIDPETMQAALDKWIRQ